MHKQQGQGIKGIKYRGKVSSSEYRKRRLLGEEMISSAPGKKKTWRIMGKCWVRGHFRQREGYKWYQFSSVTQSYLTLCDPMNCSTPGLPVHHQPPSSLKLMSIESVMPSSHLILCRPLSPPVPNPSQHQSLFQWVSSSHQVDKILEFHLQHQSFQWTPRTDFL